MMGREVSLPEPKTLKVFKFAILNSVALDNLVDLPKKAFEGSVDRLTEAGASVIKIKVPSVKEAMDLTGLLYSPEAYATWRHKIEESPEVMFSKILERFLIYFLKIHDQKFLS